MRCKVKVSGCFSPRLNAKERIERERKVIHLMKLHNYKNTSRQILTGTVGRVALLFILSVLLNMQTILSRYEETISLHRRVCNYLWTSGFIKHFFMDYNIL